MTQMLASVTSVSEALLALELGADIIDLKNPHDGALGALPFAIQKEIVEALSNRRVISATIGDTPEDMHHLHRKVMATAATGVDIVKIGIATSRIALASWRDIAWPPNSARLVAVLFADQGLDLNWIALLAEQGFFGVMLDTAEKSAGSLRAYCNNAQLREFVRSARANRLLCGLAGSLRLDDIAQLLDLAPDYLGFRGALCRNESRIEMLDRDAFRDVRARIPALTENQTLSWAATSAT